MKTKVLSWVILALLAIVGLNVAFRLMAAADNYQVALGLAIVILIGYLVMLMLLPTLKRLRWLFPLLVLAAMTAGCGTTIQPGHAGIIVDSYGKDRGVQSYTATTGRVWYNPITTTVFSYPTFVQSVVFTHSTHEGNAVNEEITFTNADQMSIAADVSLSYSLIVEKLPAFYVKFRSDDLSQFTYGYLRSLMRDKFNERAGHYTISQIMGDNGPFLSEVKAALQADLDPIGVHLEAQFGFIGAPRPPQQVIDAINLKVQATQLAIQKQNELVQVQADAAKQVAQAEGYAKSLLVKGEAESTYNRKMADSMSDRLIEKWKLDKWNGQLPTVTGTATPFINLK